jgi:hypothetical protein
VHRAPEGVTFSDEARSQVHAPAGRARQEHRGPAIAFSVDAFEHEQLSADFSPQEHFACDAQTQPWLFLPQHVVGATILKVG